MFAGLYTLISSLTRPDGPSFYRRLYGLKDADGPLTIDDPQGWEALPFLTKESLLSASVRERSFVPYRALDSFYASSGTTGLPLFGARACIRGPLYRSAYHDFKGATLSAIILPHMTERALRAEGALGRVVALDPKRMQASVALAKAAGIDSVLAHSFLMPLLCEHLSRAGVAEHIRYVEIAGEPCSAAQYEFMRARLPNATITPVYGAREVEGPIGIPCRPLGGSPLEVYHPNPDYYLELVDSQGRVLEPKEGLEAELVVTAYAGEPFAFPLIRYRIGDTVRVVERACRTHGAWSFTILGRTETDFLKIPGGMVRADEVERVLERLGVPHPDEFQLRVSEVPAERSVTTALTLSCRIPGAATPESFCAAVAQALRVGPSYTYADGVRDGHYVPLAYAEPSSAPEIAKRKRIVKI